MKFEIGNEVKVRNTGESGIITDRMFSEAKGHFVYIVKPHDGGRQIIRNEDVLEPFSQAPSFEVTAEIADNKVVIGIIYEVKDGNRYEVCRGHGHIIHEGVEGIAQACSYAFRKAFETVDTGIFFKQRKSQ